VGGIYGTGKKIAFPCNLIIRGYETFEKNNPRDFAIFKEILETKPEEYREDNQELGVIFESSDNKNP
jgi:hypothetical protein